MLEMNDKIKEREPARIDFKVGPRMFNFNKSDWLKVNSELEKIELLEESIESIDVEYKQLIEAWKKACIAAEVPLKKLFKLKRQSMNVRRKLKDARGRKARKIKGRNESIGKIVINEVNENRNKAEEKAIKEMKVNSAAFYRFVNKTKNGGKFDIGPLEVEDKVVESHEAIAQALADHHESVMTKPDAKHVETEIFERATPLSEVDVTVEKVEEAI